MNTSGYKDKAETVSRLLLNIKKQMSLLSESTDSWSTINRLPLHVFTLGEKSTVMIHGSGEPGPIGFTNDTATYYDKSFGVMCERYLEAKKIVNKLTSELFADDLSKHLINQAQGGLQIIQKLNIDVKSATVCNDKKIDMFNYPTYIPTFDFHHNGFLPTAEAFYKLQQVNDVYTCLFTILNINGKIFKDLQKISAMTYRHCTSEQIENSPYVEQFDIQCSRLIPFLKSCQSFLKDFVQDIQTHINTRGKSSERRSVPA